MSAAQRSTVRVGSAESVVQWSSIVVVGLAVVVAVWSRVGAGPEICGLEFAGDSLCFAVNRQWFGGAVTAVIAVLAAAFGLVSSTVGSRLTRRVIWVCALVAIALTGVLALTALR